MKKRTKKIALALLIVFIVTCLPLCLTACSIFDKYNSARLNMLAEEFPFVLLGNDVLSWNVFSVDPEKSFGYKQSGEPSWYDYQAATEEDMKDTYEALNMFHSEFKKIKFAKLKGNEVTIYRYLENSLTSYLSYYGSTYALDFTLIGSSYIDSQGGYVASFADSVENFAFRNEQDVKNLLAITRSTRTAFTTYLDYLGDRVDEGYPLFDETIVAMQDYLKSVIEKGGDYYLYALIRNKINSASFLSDTAKKDYISQYSDALTNSFMSGIKILADGLNEYKGYYTKKGVSYLTACGKAGEAYYEWRFEHQTGMRNVNYDEVYDELLDILIDSYTKINDILEQVKNLTDPKIKADFEAYLNEEKALLGLTTPEEMLTYLKTAAKSIVPDLKTVPEIDFKYMDETVAEISSSMAYYLKSPIDEKDSTEHITLNPHYLEGQPTTMLTTIAHEGYPGHLYAYVNEKENYSNLLMTSSSTTAFAEGWAKYTEIALLEHIAATSNDKAVKLYAEFYSYYTIVGYAENALYDIEYNYFGYGLDDFIGEDDTPEDIESLKGLLQLLMENPTVFIPYGYGVTVMVDIHNTARTALGNNYSEADFNGVLLSEGMGPTLARAYEITEEYIANKG